jgi:hypothetical protein
VREQEADAREQEADAREREADEREERLQDSARLRQHAEELHARGTRLRAQAEQAVEQAEAVLDTSQDRVRRAEAALDRAYAHANRQRANAARSVRQSEQRPVPQQHDFTDLVGRVSAMRKRTAAAAAQLARTEEQVSRIQDDLASRDPGNPEHKRRATEAREAMRRARETEQKYSNP